MRLAGTTGAIGLLICLTLAAAVTASADEAKKPEKRPPISGFLGDYSDLEPHPDKKLTLVYRKHAGVLATYDKYLIEPVLVYFHAEAKGVGVDPQELADLATFLRDEVVAALTEGNAYEVVEENGPGVVRLRSAITTSCR